MTAAASTGPSGPSTPADDTSAAAQATAAGSPAGGLDVSSLLGGVWSDLRVSLHGRLQLMSLELQQAGHALLQIVILAVAAGVLLCGAWLTLMVAVFMGTIQAGLHWGVAIAIIFLVNVGLAFVMWLMAFRLTRHLTLPATVRSLSSGLKPERTAADVHASSPGQAGESHA